MNEIRIVGTAHVSQKSVDEVRTAIADFRPTVIAVELDELRFRALKEREETPEISEVLRSGNFTQMLIQWTLSYLQRKIGMDVGVEPGADMKAAIEEAEREHLPVALVDRDIRITLSRFWKGMGLREKLRLIYALSVSLFSGEEESIDIDALTREDMVTVAIEEFRKFSPRGAEALIDERDAYIASRLLHLRMQNERVLAVVGAGHVRGVKRYLEDPAHIPPPPELTGQPRSFPYGKIFGAIVLGLFVLLILAIAFSGLGMETLLQAFMYWIVIHGILSAGCALLAGGHPLSALTAFGVSWLTALNPLVAAGWFAAITEAKIRKPSAADFRAIIHAEDFSEMRKIPLFRVVLVAALTNVGSTIATFAYYLTVLPLLHIDPGIVIVQGFGNLWHWLQGLFGVML
ncbi:MAG: TraB/GumN family protein [Methanomicrobiales archaeon]|nr:TraB/GumN family protein [Methanomicrobiales archaeon]